MKFFGIIPIRLFDLLEVAVVAYALYKLYMWMRGTLAVSILVGLMALYLVQFLVDATGMKILQAMFGSLSEIYVLAVIIIFQQEIRRVLLLVGQNPLLRRFFTSHAQQELITEVVAAIRTMSEQRTGALIVFKRSAGLRNFIETGEQLQAKVSRDLIVTLFYSQNPLHDGALIVANGRIEAARCILPVSSSQRLNPLLGLRHRAAVGMSEQTDAFVVVVSEETGNISVVENGVLRPMLSLEDFQANLTEALSASPAGDGDLASSGD